MKVAKLVSFGVLLGLLGGVGVSFAFAADPVVTVKNAWVRATVGPQKTTGAFLQIDCKTELTLVKVDSDVAAMVEMHEMKMDSGTMKMREVEQIACVPGKTTELAPGGFHIMLMNVHKPVKEGDHIALDLVFENKQKKKTTVKVDAVAKGLNAAK
ncbi:copper chaperone PCu(A)C [Undibacterium cyanobacteriorum]|uniref:Copper chaperone PCu(A)C n=1 Tax=Undibacterium cyanobacteriorum TaxID=3073561 RepID=A0ABY9RME8_9BURK|nr:copper chaperone PCu(A)C [Undibacterium sp. 20NA77.5]WMW82383.1 copper chaperone PCu(A)C [Undibacterium sp. 20NA77.5]